MRKLIILIMALVSLNAFSQKEIQELDNWSTYGDSLMFPVKVTGVSEAKHMYFIDGMPKIADEDVGTGTITNTATHVRVDIGGNEYKCRLDTLVPEITDYTTETTVSNSDPWPFWDNTDGAPNKITFLNLILNITGNGTFESAIITDIQGEVDSSYVANLIFTSTSENIDLDVGAITHGVLHIQKIGNMVVGSVTDPVSTSDAWLTVNGGGFSGGTLPSYFRPKTTGATNDFVRFHNQDAGDFFQIIFEADGTIQIRCHASDAPQIGFAYFSPN